METDDFRIEVVPGLQPGSPWTVRVLEMNSSQVDVREVVNPNIDPVRLAQLRRASWTADLALIQAIGAEVWNVVMTGNIAALFDFAKTANELKSRGLRLVLVLRDDTRPSNGAVSASAIPFEALYQQQKAQFTSLHLPVGRALQPPDLGPAPVDLPIKVLAMAASPRGKRQAKVGDELKIVRDAVAKLGPNVKLETCKDGSFQSLATHLRDYKPHVFHYIGHGEIDIVGSDPAEQPYLCFEDGTPTRGMDPITSGRLLSALRVHSSVRLVILSACATAEAPASNDPVNTAIDGMAQRIVKDESVGAVVAMQFDLEDWAAPVLAESLYDGLFAPNACLEQVVRAARNMIVGQGQGGEGERAWLNPVVYSRFRNGRVFNIVSADTEEVRRLEATAEKVKSLIPSLMAEPSFARGALTIFMGELNTLAMERSKHVGACVRIESKGAGPGQAVTLSLYLRVPRQGTFASLIVEVRHVDLALTNVDRGSDSTEDPTYKTQDADSRITAVNMSGVSWPPGEYEIAKLVLTPDQSKPRIHTAVAIVRCRVILDGQDLACKTTDSVVCVL